MGSRKKCYFEKRIFSMSQKSIVYSYSLLGRTRKFSFSKIGGITGEVLIGDHPVIVFVLTGTPIQVCGCNGNNSPANTLQGVHVTVEVMYRCGSRKILSTVPENPLLPAKDSEPNPDRDFR